MNPQHWRIYRPLAVQLALATALPADAQDANGLARCRTITDAAERLGCYDRRGYQTVSLTDAKLDQDRLRGQEVEVSGNLMIVSEIALLRSGSEDASPLVVDVKAVPREQRRKALDRCGALGCAATVRGTVDRMMTQPGIVADNIDLR